MPDSAPSPRRRALAMRVLSITGVMPLGAFFVIHLAINVRALDGELAFARAVRTIERIPALSVVEALLVFAPLLVHAVVGLGLALTTRSSTDPSPYPRTVRIAMRVTGVLVLAFLALHLPELRFRAPGARPDAGQLMTLLGEDLSTMRGGLPWRGALYLLGSACATFHFAAGLWGFFATSTRGSTARARRWAAWWATAVGASMWLLFVAVTVYHATGARLLGGHAEEMPPAGPCPVPSAAP